ncbi:MAG: 3'-5' exonuclease, partial [Prolixibacteraceae bacterium]
KIIETFLEAAKKPENANYNLSVLSNESLFLHASKGVNFVIGVIELLVDPENKISKALLLHFWKTWLKPEIHSKGVVTSVNQQNQLSLDFAEEKEKWQLETGFENEFMDELQPFIDKVKEKVLLASLDETITHIAGNFHLFEVESELPFLQTLIDKAAEIKTTISNDLSNLLYWWNEKGYKTSVSVNEDTDSVRLLTIHKAKGLEFSAVLLPFFNWDSSWSGNFAPTLWCSSEKEPFNHFPLLPVKASKDLQQTWFKMDFYDEKVSSFIDTMNLIYVAFTRAKSVLMMHCKDTEKPGKSVNSLLKPALNEITGKDPFQDGWNLEQTEFRFGEMPHFTGAKKDSNSFKLKEYVFSDFRNRLKLRINSEGFLKEGEMNRTEKNTGKLAHEILASIKTAKDIQKACKKALSEGKINEAELKEIEATIHSNFEMPEVKPWFDGSYRVINERNILSAKKIHRPDRLMISGSNAVVVDYKIGEKNPQKYNAQVKRYAQILKETGFEKVEGFLWYIHQNEVEKVCEF